MKQLNMNEIKGIAGGVKRTPKNRFEHLPDTLTAGAAGALVVGALTASCAPAAMIGVGAFYGFVGTAYIYHNYMT